MVQHFGVVRKEIWLSNVELTEIYLYLMTILVKAKQGLLYGDLQMVLGTLRDLEMEAGVNPKTISLSNVELMEIFLYHMITSEKVNQELQYSDLQTVLGIWKDAVPMIGVSPKVINKFNVAKTVIIQFQCISVELYDFLHILF